MSSNGLPPNKGTTSSFLRAIGGLVGTTEDTKKPSIVLQQPIGDIEFSTLKELNAYLKNTYKIKLRM